METYYWIEARDHKNISLVTHVPNDSDVDKYPTIIYAHGFTGNKTGDNRMGVDLARFLCEKGFVVIRFDYIGSGESEGDFETGTSFSGWLEDFQTVLKWVENFTYTDSSKIGIIGHSFSGAIVTHIPTICPTVKKVCALAPVFKLKESFKETIIGDRLWEAALSGQVIQDFYNKKYSLAPFFVKDLLTFDMKETAKKVSTPMLIIHGEKDKVLPYQDSIELYNTLNIEQKELKLLKQEEHLFSHAIHPLLLQWFNEWLDEEE